MKPVLTYTLRGFQVGMWGLVLIVVVIIFTLVIHETGTYGDVIPYFHAVYEEVMIKHFMPNAVFTMETILKHYWEWALVVLLLPLAVGFLIGLGKRQRRKEAEPVGQK
jgi:type II secretory pathway component PulF